MNQTTKDLVEEYKNKKIHWLEIAPIFEGLLDNHEDLKDYNLSDFAVRAIVTSYRFLKTRKPNILKNPDSFKVSYYVINYLPTIYSKMKDTDKDKKFENLVEQAIRGELSDRKIRKISKSLDSPEKRMTRDIPSKNNVEQASDSLKAFGDCLNLMDHMIETSLRNNSYAQLRALYAAQCDTVATQLNCIADEEFMRNWQERREEKL